MIREEVRETLQKVFPRGQILKGLNLEKNQAQSELLSVAQVESGTRNSPASVIDLTTQSGGSLQKSAPLTIVGSDVSIASTSSNPKNGGNATSFPRLLHGRVLSPLPRCLR